MKSILSNRINSGVGAPGTSRTRSRSFHHLPSMAPRSGAATAAAIGQARAARAESQEAPKLNPKEEADYKALNAVSGQ